jgi:hypothetical protein
LRSKRTTGERTADRPVHHQIREQFLRQPLDLGLADFAPLWTETRDAILSRLDEITMEDLCRRARKLGIAHGAKLKPDFNI